MKLTLKNFMKHSSLEIELQKGINWIDGPNGSGKSCIYDALRFALGFEPRGYGRHQDKLIKLGQKSCKVTLEEAGYSITRSKSKSSHTLKIVNESKMFQSDSLEDIALVTEEVFGIKHHILKLIMKPFAFSDIDDRRAVLSELTLSVSADVISETLQKETKLDKKSADYCAGRVKSVGFDKLIEEISLERVKLSRDITDIDKKMSTDTAVLEEKKKSVDSLNEDLTYQERELKLVSDQYDAMLKAKEKQDKVNLDLKEKQDKYLVLLQDKTNEYNEAKIKLRELVDNVEKHWIPDDLPIIRCKVVRDTSATEPILRVGDDSVVSGQTVDVAVLPDTSQWDDGPLSTAREELGKKIADLEQELKKLSAEHEGEMANTKEKLDVGSNTGDIIFSRHVLDNLGARRAVLLGSVEELRRQLAYKFTGSKALGSGESVPAQSGQTLPGSSETPLTTLNASSQDGSSNPDTSATTNEIEVVQQRLEEHKRNRAAKSALYNKYDFLIQGMGAKGTVQKTLAVRSISDLNKSLIKSSQVSYDGIPALPLIKIDEDGNVESEGVMSELRSVGERLVDSAQLVFSISLSMRRKGDTCAHTFMWVDDINDLDKSRKESLLAWLTFLRDDFDYIVLATCGAARPSAPDGLIKFVGL